MEPKTAPTVPELEAHDEIEQLFANILGDSTDVSHPEALEMVDLETLACRARIEHERFCQDRPEDSRFAYEIFRRALVEQDEHAWEYIYNQYRTLVIRWVERGKAFASSNETSEFFANAAFLRFAQAITPDKFAQFPMLSAVLNYLRRCAHSVVIDQLRTSACGSTISQDALLCGYAAQIRADEEAIARISALEAWRYITTLAHDQAEHEVIYCSFILEMRPAEIYAVRRHLFASVREVYMVKRNVLQRLRHNQTLQDMISSTSPEGCQIGGKHGTENGPQRSGTRTIR